MMYWNAHKHTSRGSVPTSAWTTSTCSRSARKGSSKSTPRTPPSSSSHGLRSKGVTHLTQITNLGIQTSSSWAPGPLLDRKETTSKLLRSAKIWASISGRPHSPSLLSPQTQMCGHPAGAPHSVHQETQRASDQDVHVVGGMDRFDGFRRRIRRVWPRIFARISETPQNRRWRGTHGLVGEIMATLFDHGWDASQTERWTSADGTTFLLSEPELLSDPSPPFRCFEAILLADFWLAAHGGSCGLGLAGGCDMTVLQRRWNTLFKSDTQAAGMLLNSVAGGNWVRARNAAHLVESALCARCGQHDETEAHPLWECEHNSTLDVPPVPLAARTLGDAETCPALGHKFPIPEDTPLFCCKEAATSDIISPRHGEHTLVAFGDTSGGRYASDTRCRRVRTAAVILDFPGARQDGPHATISRKRRKSSGYRRVSRKLSPCRRLDAPQTTPRGEY